MVDSKYNLIATVNHKPSKKNDGHYTAVNNSPTLRSWYKYDNDIVNLVQFMKGNTNSVLMDFQKTASILFYIDVRYVSVCHNNLRNNDEVIDWTQMSSNYRSVTGCHLILVVEQHLVLVIKLHLVIVVEQQLIQIFNIC
jgi:hypothetical protein